MTMVRLRKLWFQIHKWIGLILAVLIIPISLTGSALVWHEAIDEGMHPQRHAVTGPVSLPVQAYAEAARAELEPGERLSRIEIPTEDGEAVTASATKPGKGRPQRSTLYLDPATGKLLDREKSGEGIFAMFHQLHGSLMIPGTGRQIVGWIGVAMLISSLTGLWLWWPVSGSVRRGFRWKRHRNTDTNLHHMLGFWISVPLFVLSLTGVWISFPQVFAGLDGAQPQQRGPSRAELARAQPLVAPVTPLALAIDSAETAGKGKTVSISWPTDLKPQWAIEVAPAKGPRTSVTVNDTDGATKAAPARARGQRSGGGETLARTMRKLHDGTDQSVIWQVIIFLGGILPAILAVTGIIMWWRARGWRGDLARKRKAKA